MLNPREQAVIIWLVIVIIYALSIKDVRSTIPGIIKSLLSLMRHPILIITNLYIILMFLAMYLLKIIDNDLVKDYLVWILLALYPMISRVSSKFAQVSVKGIFIETFKFSVIPIYIINEYTLSIWAELFILPIVALIGGLLALSDKDEKYTQVKKLLNSILMIIGFVLIIVAFIGFLNNLDDAAKIEFWKKMFMDFIGITLHIPLLFLLQYMCLYEGILIRTNITNKLSRMGSLLIIFRKYKFKKQTLISQLRNHELRHVKTMKELKDTLKVNSEKS